VPAGGRSFAFSFVCHRGELEPKAVLLAASLRRHAPAGCELYATVPRPHQVWGEPAEETLAAFEDLGVTLVEVDAPFGRERAAMANATTLHVPAQADRLVSLDSDILALAPFQDRPLFDADVTIKPVDLETWTHEDETWRRTYRACGLDLPPDRVTTTVSREFRPPNYNAGVKVLRDPRRLAEEWQRCAEALIEVEDQLPFREEFWSNQPALAVAIRRAGFTVAEAGEDLNYPAHLRALPSTGPLPVFCHYHYPRIVRAEPALRLLVRELADDHPLVGRALAGRPGWDSLLRQPRFRARRPKPPRDMLITGISRSGTSYLCHLLHRHSDCVALIDPPELFGALEHQAVPWGVPAYFQETRATIAEGGMVVSKVDGDLPVTDTYPDDVRARYAPSPASADFVLAVKNVRALLARLEAVRPLLDGTRLVLCARDPYDAIASWKRSFEHLREADVHGTAVSRPDNPLLARRDRDELQLIATCTDVAERRARFWAWSARRVLEQRDGAVLVDYDRLVREPSATVAEVTAGLEPGPPPADLEPSDPRRHRELLHDRDREAIGDICLPLARELGLVVRAEPRRRGTQPPSNFALPPVGLMRHVGGARDGAEDEHFINRGHAGSERIRRLLPAGWSFVGKRVLDFGCGCGRTLRHFQPEAEQAELWGCDVHAESIDWVREHIPWVRAFRNEPLPPLPHDDGYFDLIWGLSVFTHLDVDWAPWLLELRRVLADDGLLVLTFLNEEAQRLWQNLSGQEWDEDRVGMITFGTGTPMEKGGPVVFHAPWWIAAHWGRAFEIVELERRGGDHPQGHALLRKRPADLTPAELERPEPGEPRELAAATLQARLSRRELGEARRAAAESEAGLASERDRLFETVEAFRRSRSWRWMRPLRDLRGRLSGSRR
jgi:SAM-dependent methyltransferase